MIRLLLILLGGLVLEALGVVLLGRGLKEIGGVSPVTAAEFGRLVLKGICNRNILAGTALEAAYFGCLLHLMARADVSFIWPVTALGFLFTTIAARFWLHEQVSPLRWFGVMLIVAGAAVITYTEKNKPKGAAPISSHSSP